MRDRRRAAHRIAAALAAACVAAAATAQPLRPTRHQPDFTVSIKFMTKQEVIDTCLALGAWRGVPISAIRRTDNVGCNAYYPDRAHCVIYAAVPRSLDDAIRFEVLGHELLHCAIGAYHD